jgi:hypothetical protein
MKFLAPLVVATLLVGFSASCVVAEKPPEKVEEQKGLEEIVPETQDLPTVRWELGQVSETERQ